MPGVLPCMKSSLQFFAVVFTLTVGCFGSQAVLAQSAPASSPSASATPLTADDKAKLMKVRTQALADNPDLKTEGDALKKQGQALKGGNATDAQKDDFTLAMADHMKKVKAAMVKIDPSVEPLVDQWMAEMKAKRAAAGN